MKTTKRTWFLFSPADAPAVTKRLNDWAQQGWELAEERDGRRFFVSLERTNRTELVYDAVPAMPGRTQETLRNLVQAREQRGWEPVATINGLDLYRSKPCVSPQPMEETGERRSLCLCEGPKGLFALLLTVVFFVLRGTQGPWYLSHLGLFWHWAAIPMAVGMAIFALWWGVHAIRSGVNSGVLLWMRSLLSVAARVGIWLFLLLLALDCMPLGYAAALMALGTLLVLWIHGRRELSVSASMLQAFVIGVGLIVAMALHTVLPSAFLPVGKSLSAADFHLSDGMLEYTESEEQGSLLVTERDYGESWSDDVAFSGETYRCISEGMAQRVMSDLLALDGASSEETLWYNEDGSRLIFRQGRYVVKLWAAQADLRGEDTRQVLQAYCEALEQS